MDDITLACLGDKEAQERVTERGEPLNCPFCGGHAILVDAPECWYRCEACGSYGPEANGPKSALAKWNTRPALLTPEQIKRLEEIE